MTDLPAPQPAAVPHAPIPQMTGLRKVAYLMITIGTGAAANIMKELAGKDPELQEKIAAEILQIRSVPTEYRNYILEEAYSGLFAEMGDMEGGQSYAIDLFIEAFGEDKGMALMERVFVKQQRKKFEFLTKLDDAVVAANLQQESPQAIAIVLAHLEARHAAKILAMLPPELEFEVAQRIANSDARDLSEPAIAQLEDGVRSRLTRNEASATTKVGGKGPLAALLNQIEQSASKAILDDLERKDPQTAADVRKLMFVFEDIIKLTTQDVAQIVRSVEIGTLAKALRNADNALKDKFFGAVSNRVVETLREEMELTQRMTKKQMEEAQDAIVAKVRELEHDGLLVIPSGDEEYV